MSRFHPYIRLAICAASILFALAIVNATILAALGVSSRINHRIFDDEVRVFFASDTNRLVLSVLAYPFLLLGLVGSRNLLDQRSFVSLGFRRQRALPDSLWGAVCGALTVSLLFALLWLCGGVRVAGYSPESFQIGVVESIHKSLVCLCLIACMAFVQEAAFRGYALHNLNAGGGWPGAVLAQAAVFALVRPLDFLGHGETGLMEYWTTPWAFVNVAMLGCFYALCFRKTGSLWYGIGFHCAFNLFTTTIWSLPVSETPGFRLLDVTGGQQTLLSGAPFGVEASLMLVPIVACLLYLISTLADHPQAQLDLDLSGNAELGSTDGAHEIPKAETEQGPSRYRTSMRPSSETAELDPAFFRTARRYLPDEGQMISEAVATDGALRIDVTDLPISHSIVDDASTEAVDFSIGTEQAEHQVVLPRDETHGNAETAPLRDPASGRPDDPTIEPPQVIAPRPKRPRW